MVVRWIRETTGWFLLVYLDDLLFPVATKDAIDPQEFARRAEFVRAVFEALGLSINTKSCLVPSK